MSSVASQSHSAKCPAGCRAPYVRRGFFERLRDGRRLQRFRCRGCGRSFSEATADPCFGQRKRDLNPAVARLLTGGYSQRRAARDLGVTRKTIVRKFIFLGQRAAHVLAETNRRHRPASHWEFDELITSEHTKCKPLSVVMAVETKSRRILGFRVATMPAPGPLAKISRAKYGRRPDGRTSARRELFSELGELVDPGGVIKSDQSSFYPRDVATFFPAAEHRRYKGRPGCVTGQGELKRLGNDPIFSVNHTFAMLRANMNRLFRRTWCTTKKSERLALHLNLYAVRHNLDLIINKIH